MRAEQHNRLKILIADDSELNRTVLADILGKKYEVTVAKDGEQVLYEICQSGAKPDLLLLGISMPKIDGIEVVARLEQEGLFNHIPVIMISSDSSMEAIERAYELGASECIAAPFNAAVVHKRVMNTILLYAKKNELRTLVAKQKHCEGDETTDFIESMLYNDTTLFGRTARLLEQERAKRYFLAALTKEIQFEYKVAPSVLTISAAGVDRLKLDEVIEDPMHNKKLRNLISVSELETLSEELRSTSSEQPVITHDCKVNCDGERRWFRILAMALWSEEEPSLFVGFIGKAVDIHDSRLKLNALEQRASHDALTGLFNRTYAQEKIAERMSDRPTAQFALAMIDLDYFKSANDKYGHLFGDSVLKHMADMLRQSIRGSDIAARVGGDEFLIFLEYKMDLAPIVERIFTSLSGTYEDFPISVSMGISKVEGEAISYEELFHKADKALYTAKQAGRGQYCFYDSSMEQMLSVITPIEST